MFDVTYRLSSEFIQWLDSGGIAGSVLASRLHAHFSLLSIRLVEAGPDVTNHPLVTDGRNAGGVVGSELNWDYSTVSRQRLNVRECPNHAGKALGGRSAIKACHMNAIHQVRKGKGKQKEFPSEGGGIRGDASDDDAWATLVNDSRWSYKRRASIFLHD